MQVISVEGFKANNFLTEAFYNSDIVTYFWMKSMYVHRSVVFKIW